MTCKDFFPFSLFAELLLSNAWGFVVLFVVVMRSFVTRLAFPGVSFRTEVPPLSESFLRVETEHLSVPCLRRLCPADAKAVIVYCHGNAMAISEMEKFCVLLSKQFSCHVYIPEIPGERYDWGRTAFKSGVAEPASEEFYCEAVVGTFDHAASAHPELPVLVWGQSLGSGAACELVKLSLSYWLFLLMFSHQVTRRPQAAGLVLQSGLLSCLKVASVSLPSLWGVDVFVNHRKAPHIAMPALVMHGDVDQVGCAVLCFGLFLCVFLLQKVINVEHGRQLARLLPGLVEYREMPGAGHNDMEARCWPAMVAGVRALLAQLNKSES